MYAVRKATVANGAALSEAVDFRGLKSGVMLTPSTLNATTKVAFYVCHEESGTYLPLYGQTGSLVEVTVDVAAAKAFPLPADLAGAHWFKVWTEASGTSVNQTGNKVFSFSMEA